MAIDPNNLAGTAKLTFADEFDTLSLWSGKNGTWSTTWWYREKWDKPGAKSTFGDVPDQQWYIDHRFKATERVKPWRVNNGILTIEAARTDPAIAKYVDDFPYTSGFINSYNSFSQQYGYFEIKAKLPAGKGLWPAFWLLPKDGSWPPEIDVLEVLGHDTTTLYSTVHTKATGKHEKDGVTVKTPDLSAGFHRYGVDWQKDRISFYFDGRKTGEVATPPDLHKPMYMIVNLTVGGGWSGPPNDSTPFPARIEVDYIRAYEALPAAAVGPPLPVPTGSEGGGLPLIAGGGAAILLLVAAAAAIVRARPAQG